MGNSLGVKGLNQKANHTVENEVFRVWVTITLTCTTCKMVCVGLVWGFVKSAENIAKN